MFVDIGARDKKEVEKLGINIGDIIIPHSES
jgi:putative aminopeptidase FrvX